MCSLNHSRHFFTSWPKSCRVMSFSDARASSLERPRTYLDRDSSGSSSLRKHRGIRRIRITLSSALPQRPLPCSAFSCLVLLFAAHLLEALKETLIHGGMQAFGE